MNVGGFKYWVGDSKSVLVLMLTDVVGSTALAQTLGDESYGNVRRAHFDRVRRLIAKYDGKEIKTLGDAFKDVFRTVGNAVWCALDLNADTGHRYIRIRAAIHVGTVYVEEEDACGTMVNYTTRMMSCANGRQIWLSHQAKQYLDEERRLDLRHLKWTEFPNCDLREFGKYENLWFAMVPDRWCLTRTSSKRNFQSDR